MSDEARIVVDGVELTVTQTGNSVSVLKVIGRDRKRNVAITSSRQFTLEDPAAILLLEKLKIVAELPTVRCTCSYAYGYSDHAEHCQSLYVAEYVGPEDD